MGDLKIKKIKDKIELDVSAQACFCIRWVTINSRVYNADPTGGRCYSQYSPSGHWAEPYF